MIDAHLSALRNCILFNGISSEQLKSMLACLEPIVMSFRRNEFVARSGDKLNGLGIIIEGGASVYKESISGKRILIKNIKEGELFGEIAVFARQETWPSFVQANSPLKICYLSKDKLTGQCEKLCSWHTKLINNMLWVVSMRALALNKKVDYISIKTMRAKLCTYIYEQYQKKGTLTLNLDLNRTQLADFLNVSRPSMSRELSRMKDEKIIDFHLSSIKILDIDTLKSYCE
jgi:CRP-like cAMP-binding protein